MTERPILFSAPMVRAIRDGSKTQTRRIYKPKGKFPFLDAEPHDASGYGGGFFTDYGPCPYGAVGDQLWVRETFLYRGSKKFIVYRADFEDAAAAGIGGLYGNWKPSIHMPRWASRISLEITEVRVQRLQDISEEDAMAEGCQQAYFGSEVPGRAAPFLTGPNFRAGFAILWQSVYGPGSWEANPWVWAISFKRVTG